MARSERLRFWRDRLRCRGWFGDLIAVGRHITGVQCSANFDGELNGPWAIAEFGTTLIDEALLMQMGVNALNSIPQEQLAATGIVL
jgi:hypothetical protein